MRGALDKAEDQRVKPTQTESAAREVEISYTIPSEGGRSSFAARRRGRRVSLGVVVALMRWQLATPAGPGGILGIIGSTRCSGAANGLPTPERRRQHECRRVAERKGMGPGASGRRRRSCWYAAGERLSSAQTLVALACSAPSDL